MGGRAFDGLEEVASSGRGGGYGGIGERGNKAQNHVKSADISRIPTVGRNLDTSLRTSERGGRAFDGRGQMASLAEKGA